MPGPAGLPDGGVNNRLEQVISVAGIPERSPPNHWHLAEEDACRMIVTRQQMPSLPWRWGKEDHSLSFNLLPVPGLHSLAANFILFYFFWLASFSPCFIFPEVHLSPSRAMPPLAEGSMANAGLNDPRHPFLLCTLVGKVAWSRGENYGFWSFL